MDWNKFTIKHFYGVIRIVTLLLAKVIVARGLVTA